MAVEFADEGIQKLVYQTEPIKPSELTQEDLITIGDFCAKNPDFNRTRSYYILLEMLRFQRKPAFIYEQFTELQMFFKNIKISERTKSRQLSDCLKAVPFLFKIKQFKAKNPDGSEYDKKVIFPNYDAIILLLTQYPNTAQKMAETLMNG
jgi:hypothetical protein